MSKILNMTPPWGSDVVRREGHQRHLPRVRVVGDRRVRGEARRLPARPLARRHEQADQDHQLDPRAAVRPRRDDTGAARGARRRDPPDDHRHRAGPLLTLAGNGLPDRPGVPGAARRGVPVSPRRRGTAMRASMTTPKALARAAGVLYLLLAGAAFNEGYVLPRIVKSGDAAATAGNIRASATLFRVGFVGDMVAATCWLLLAMALYLLLYHVIKSSYFPKPLGVLLIIGCISYIASMFIRVLAPAVGTSTAPLFITIAGTAELCFLAWLLIKAVNVPVPGGQAPAIAQPRSP